MRNVPRALERGPGGGLPVAADDAGETFDRDLGYLRAFLDKLASHAAALPESTALRLQSLLAEERPRWKEIEALLRGEAMAVDAAPAKSPQEPEAAIAHAIAKVAAPKANGVRQQFTVGSLRGKAH